MQVGSIQEKKPMMITFGECESEMLLRPMQGDLSQKQNEAFGKGQRAFCLKLFYIDAVNKPWN